MMVSRLSPFIFVSEPAMTKRLLYLRRWLLSVTRHEIAVFLTGGMTKCPRWGGKQRPRVGVNAIYLVSICVSIRSIDCAPAARSPALLTADPTYSSSWPWTSWTLASTLTSSHLSSPHQVSHFCNRPAYGSKIENMKSLINIMRHFINFLVHIYIIR